MTRVDVLVMTLVCEMTMGFQIQKSANSLVLRLPKSFALQISAESGFAGRTGD